MTSARSHVSLTTLLEGSSKLMDESFLWSALHQATGTLIHLTSRDHSIWEAGPSLLITPDTLLMYASGAVLFCSGLPDNPSGDFSPPELSLSSPGWSKPTVVKAYVYSLGATFAHALDTLESKDHVSRDMVELLSLMSSGSPFDRPQLPGIVRSCRSHLAGAKPSVLLGRAVRRAAGRSSMESLSSSFTTSTNSLNSSYSNSSIQSAGRRDSYYTHLRKSSVERASSFLGKTDQVRIPAVSRNEWHSMDTLLSAPERSLPPQPRPASAHKARRRSIHGSFSTGLQRTPSSLSTQSDHSSPLHQHHPAPDSGGPSTNGTPGSDHAHTPRSAAGLPYGAVRPHSTAARRSFGSYQDVGVSAERTIRPSMSASMEKIFSIRKSSGDYSFGKDFPQFMYSPRNEEEDFKDEANHTAAKTNRFSRESLNTSDKSRSPHLYSLSAHSSLQYDSSNSDPRLDNPSSHLDDSPSRLDNSSSHLDNLSSHLDSLPGSSAQLDTLDQSEDAQSDLSLPLDPTVSRSRSQDGMSDSSPIVDGSPLQSARDTEPLHFRLETAADQSSNSPEQVNLLSDSAETGDGVSLNRQDVSSLKDTSENSPDSAPRSLDRRSTSSPVAPVDTRDAPSPSPRAKRKRGDFKVEFVLTRPEKRNKGAKDNKTEEEAMIMTVHDTQASGGMSFSLWESPRMSAHERREESEARHPVLSLTNPPDSPPDTPAHPGPRSLPLITPLALTLTPPGGPSESPPATPPDLPDYPPPLFTPYRPDIQLNLDVTDESYHDDDLASADTVLDGQGRSRRSEDDHPTAVDRHRTSEDGNRDEGGDDDDDDDEMNGSFQRSSTPPSLPISLPPLETPTKPAKQVSFVPNVGVNEGSGDSNDGGNGDDDTSRNWSSVGFEQDVLKSVELRLASLSDSEPTESKDQVAAVDESATVSKAFETASSKQKTAVEEEECDGEGEKEEETKREGIRHAICIDSPVEENVFSVDVDNAGIYSAVVKRPESEVPDNLRKPSLSYIMQNRRASLEQIQSQETSDKTEDDYAVPLDVLKSQQSSRHSDASLEGFITYATITGATRKQTTHIKVRLPETTQQSGLSDIVELSGEFHAAAGDKRGSTISAENPYEMVLPRRDDLSGMVSSWMSGPYETISDVEVEGEEEGRGEAPAGAARPRPRPMEQRSRAGSVEKVNWLLGPDYSKLHRSTSIIISDKSSRAVARGRRVVSVVLLDSRILEVLVEHDSCVREVHDQVSAALSLEEPYLFGLSLVKGPGGEEYFLELKKTLEKYAPKNWIKREAPPPQSRNPHSQLHEFIINFRIMYYIGREMIRTVSASTRYHLCLQVRKDLLSGKLYAPLSSSLILGALLALLEGKTALSDATEVSDFVSSTVLEDGKRDRNNVLQEMNGYIASLTGLSQDELRIVFLMEACSLDDYGVLYYGMASKKQQPMGSYLLGVSVQGVSIQTINNNQRMILSELPWKHIANIYFKNRKFVLEPDSSPPVVLYGGDSRRARYLWNLVVLLHRFSVFQKRNSQRDSQYIQDGVKLVRLLKRPKQGIGLRIGSNAAGVFVKHIYKDGPADVDGQLDTGDRVMSVNGREVHSHPQASELIKDSLLLVSLLVDKTFTDNSRPKPSDLESSVEVLRRASSVIVAIQPAIPQGIPEEEEPIDHTHTDKPTLVSVSSSEHDYTDHHHHEVSSDATHSIEGSTTPSDQQTTLPFPAHQETTPPTDQETTPSIDCVTTPPTDQETTPSIDCVTTPPTDQETTPSIDRVITPPADQAPTSTSDLTTPPQSTSSEPHSGKDSPADETQNRERAANTSPPKAGSPPTVTDDDGGEYEQLSPDEPSTTRAGQDQVDSVPQEKTITITRHPQKTTFGVNFKIKERKVFVKYIQPSCPAAFSGLRVDQEVVSLNDVHLQGRPLVQIIDILMHSLGTAKLVVKSV